MDDVNGGHGGASCLDCGTGLVGAYCFRCGQSAAIHRTLGAWGHDFTHGVLHFEAAGWRTLAWLLTRPGELTRRYVDGQRRRFVSPLALYLFAVFVLYVAYALLGSAIDVDGDHPASPAARQAQLERRIVDLRQRQETRLDPDDRRDIDDAIAEARASLKRTTLDARTRTADHADDAHVDTGHPMLDRWINKAIRDPELLLFKLEANGYKFSWALIPLSLPSMWLLFAWRRDVHLFDLAVFTTYSLGFTSLLAALMIAWSRVQGLPAAGWLGLAYPVHLFAQLRGAWGLGRVAAGLATVAVATVASVTFAAWVALLLLMGVAG